MFEIVQILVVPGFFVGGCMILYTASHYYLVQDPKQFYSVFNTGVVEIFTKTEWSAAANQTWAILEKSNPHFGYSFVLGWISNVLIIISYNIAFLALHKLGRGYKLGLSYQSLASSDES